MTAILGNLFFNPLSGLYSSIAAHLQILGYSKAAAELARQGMYEEAKALMLELEEFKANRK